MGRLPTFHAGLRTAAGVVMLLVAVALIFTLTAAVVPGSTIGAGGGSLSGFVP